MAKDSIISNSSYTNKDFQSIYPALLDLVKKITYRWDPSISNESDPGVILLKLNALIADKCNYNIDKNILECFPLSVTQDRNARQLFEQLGYYMHWYLAATGQISMIWAADSPTNATSYAIPKFTMVTDDSQSIVYTITDDLPLVVGSTNVFNVMQGVINDYSLNGSTLITAQNLDKNNRLYFQDSNVAQNGIFICNSSVLNYDEWIRKDNLTVETVSANSRFYKFGVTLDTNICYIEFPTNAEELIGDGINIKYIKTDGYSGNIQPLTLSRLYENLTVNINGEEKLLNSDYVTITNVNPIVNGEDPESINSAYQGYKKIVGTFDTLVTLRDYINAIRRFPNVANGFVTDRTTDANLSANIMQIVNDVDQRNSVPLKFADGETQMFPYTLNLTMLYARDDYSDVVTYTDFDNTFRLLDDIDLERGTNYVQSAKEYLSNEKHIQQEFISPSYTVENNYLFPNILCFIKNKYKINVKVTPQYKLTQTQIEEIQSNIETELLNKFNSREVEFGEEIDYDYLYDVITNSDERIKSINLDDLSYQTYAVYFVIDGTVPKFIDVPIGGISTWFNSISDLKTGYHLTSDPYSNQPDPQVDAVKFASATNYAHGQFTIKAVVDTDVTTSGTDFSATLTSSFDPSDIFILTNGSASTVSILYNASSATHWMFNGGVNDGRVINTLTPYGINVVGTPNNGDTITLTPTVSYSITATQESTQIDTVNGEFNPRDNVSLSEYGLSASAVGWNMSFFALGIIDSPVLTSNLSVNYPNLPSYLEAEIIARNILAGKTPYFVVDSELPKFHINQKDVESHEITSIKLNGWLSVDSLDTSEHTIISNVDDNTICRFYAPNLITTDTYSSYVKYEYHLDNNIQANSSYKLGSDEYVAFYWSGGVDSGYNYAVYGEGTVINPSFYIASGYPKAGGVDLLLPQVLDTLLQNADVPKKISGVTYTLASTIDENNSVAKHVDDLSNNGYSLSSEKNISIQLMNQVRLDSSFLCSWVLSTQTPDNKYVLFEEGEEERILRQNEVFIYTNAQKSSLVILGQGTKLSRDTTVWSDVWDCSAYDYSEVASNGVNALVDIPNGLQTVPDGAMVVVTEMKYIAIPPGGKIKLTGNNVDSDFKVNLNDTISLSSDYYSAVSYKSKNDSDFISLPLGYSSVVDDLSWQLECAGVVDIIPSEYMELVGTDEIKNQTIVLNGDTNLSYTYPYSVSSSSDIYGEGDVPTDSLVLCFKQAENEQWGDTDEDKIVYSDLGDEVTISFKYGLDSEASDPSDGVVVLPIEGADSFCLFSVDASNIPIGIPNLKVYISYVDKSGSDTTQEEILPNDIYTRRFDTSLYSSVKFSVDGLPSDGQPVILVLSNLKPVNNYWGDSNRADAIETKMLDILSRQTTPKEFDWGYEVEEDELIADPLDPKSFFDFNHEYNKFTIGQLDTNSINRSRPLDYSIIVTNKVR